MSCSVDCIIKQTRIFCSFSKLRAWGRWPQLEKITEISYVDQRTWVCIFMVMYSCHAKAINIDINYIRGYLALYGIWIAITVEA